MPTDDEIWPVVCLHNSTELWNLFLEFPWEIVPVLFQTTIYILSSRRMEKGLYNT